MKKKIYKFISDISRLKKISLIILVDLFMIFFSFVFTYYLFNNNIIYFNITNISLIIIVSLLSIPIFYCFGLYKSLIQYIDYESVIDIFKAVTIYLILISMLFYFLNLQNFSKRILVINYAFIILLIIYSRYFAKKFIYEYLIENKYSNNNINNKRRVIIYGANNYGIQIENNIKNYNDLEIVGFVDYEKSKIGQYIGKYKIYSMDEFNKSIEKLNPSEIIFPYNTENIIIEKFDNLKKNKNLKTLLSPNLSVTNIFQKNIEFDELDIKTLLSRKIIDPVPSLVEKNIYNKNILITGAGGSVGSELSRIIAENSPRKIILLDKSEYNLYQIYNEINSKILKTNIQLLPILLSILEYDQLFDLINENNIQVVFHAAAYKHVDIVQNNKFYCLKNNILGTFNCIQASIKNRVENFVLISTDKAVRPKNFMGSSKRFAELMILYYSKKQEKKNSTNFCAVRFGNVVGSSGSVIPLFEKQINEGGPVTVTDKKAKRYFMSINEAAELVIQSSSISLNGEIFVLDMGEPVSIDYVAKKMIQQRNESYLKNKVLNKEIKIIYTGLRPGEKLEEELFLDNKLSTVHPKIYKVDENISKIDDEFENNINELIKHIDQKNDDKINSVLSKSIESLKE